MNSPARRNDWGFFEEGNMPMLVPFVFRFPNALVPTAQRVAIVGPFNGWNPAVHLLTKAAGGDWTITIYLPPGRTVYNFSVDGTLWLDPHDEGRIPSCWGGEYSIRYIRRRMRRNPAQSSPHFSTGAMRMVPRPA